MNDSVIIVYTGTKEVKFEGAWTLAVLRNGMLRLNNERGQCVFKNWDYYEWAKPTGAVV